MRTSEVSPLGGGHKASESFEQSWRKSPHPDEGGDRVSRRKPWEKTLKSPSKLNALAHGGRAPCRMAGAGECRPAATADAYTRGGRAAAALTPALMWWVSEVRGPGFEWVLITRASEQAPRPRWHQPPSVPPKAAENGLPALWSCAQDRNSLHRIQTPATVTPEKPQA